MNKASYRITLEIPVEVWSKTFQDGAMRACETLEDSGYEDGRYPFDREMFAAGLAGMLKHVAFESALAFLQAKHGRDHVTTIENGELNTAYHKAAEWIAGDLSGIVVSQEGWKVSCQRD